MGDSGLRQPLSQTVDASALADTNVQSTVEPATVRMPAVAPSPQAAATSAADDAESRLSRGEQLPRIGRYVLLRALGEGGMGVVYAAYDEELDRKVALKLLHPSRQGDGQLRARILREAQALARVSAPNVVHVYQVGEVEGQLFIAMEFVNGTTLTRWQSETGRTWQEILRILNPIQNSNNSHCLPSRDRAWS
jgi:serine/threonine-protein kinase